MPTVQSAMRYVAELDLDVPKRDPNAPALVEPVYEDLKKQSAVVGSSLASFSAGVPKELRRDVVNSVLLAQASAKKRVPDATKTPEWYEAYFEVLTNVGWILEEKSFAEYVETAENFSAHEAILKVAAVVLGAGTTALALVTTTLEAMRSMDANSPWITIFNRETQRAKAARFQLCTATQENGSVVLSIVAFALEARSQVTQVLFFKAKSSEAKLRHYASKVSLDPDVLGAIGGAIRSKVIALLEDNVRVMET